MKVNEVHRSKTPSFNKRRPVTVRRGGPGSGTYFHPVPVLLVVASPTRRASSPLHGHLCRTHSLRASHVSRHSSTNTAVPAASSYQVYKPQVLSDGVFWSTASLQAVFSRICKVGLGILLSTNSACKGALDKVTPDALTLYFFKMKLKTIHLYCLHRNSRISGRVMRGMGLYVSLLSTSQLRHATFPAEGARCGE